MDVQSTVKRILACVGGAENLLAVSQQSAGLSLVVADAGKVDRRQLACIEGAQSTPDTHGRLRITLHTGAAPAPSRRI